MTPPTNERSPIVEKESRASVDREEAADDLLRGQDTPAMEWKFFLGACFLTAALLVPHVAPRPVIAGMALAAVIKWAWRRIHRG